MNLLTKLEVLLTRFFVWDCKGTLFFFTSKFFVTFFHTFLVVFYDKKPKWLIIKKLQKQLFLRLFES